MKQEIKKKYPGKAPGFDKESTTKYNNVEESVKE
jgi:hypothetical protein